MRPNIYFLGVAVDERECASRKSMQVEKMKTTGVPSKHSSYIIKNWVEKKKLTKGNG